MLRKETWPSVIVGIMIGFLTLFSFAFFHHTLGTTTTFVRLAAIVWNIIDPEHLQENAYYKTYLDQNTWINWQFASVIGIFLGSYLASIQARKRKVEFVPDLWRHRFGASKIYRSSGAFIGGMILLFGARLAGGCTSGHAISGGMQLEVSGWLFMIALFATAVPTAFLLYSSALKNNQ